MIAITVGFLLLAVGVVGVRYAPAIVAAQHRQGMAPLEETAELETGDRIRVTRWMGVALAVVGCVALGYGVGVV